MNGAARVALLGLFAAQVLIAPALAQKAVSAVSAKPGPSARTQVPFDVKGFRIGDSFESVKLKFADDAENFICNQNSCTALMTSGKFPAYYRRALGEPILSYEFQFNDGVLQAARYALQRSALQPLTAAMTDAYGPPSEPCRSKDDCTEIIWRRGDHWLVLSWSNGTAKHDLFMQVILSTPKPPGASSKTRDF